MPPGQVGRAVGLSLMPLPTGKHQWPKQPPAVLEGKVDERWGMCVMAPPDPPKAGAGDPHAISAASGIQDSLQYKTKQSFTLEREKSLSGKASSKDTFCACSGVAIVLPPSLFPYLCSMSRCKLSALSSSC